MTYRVGDYGKDISFIVTIDDEKGISEALKATLTIRNGNNVVKKDCVLLKDLNKVSYRLERGVITAKGPITFDLKITWMDAELKIDEIVTDTVN